MVYGVGTRSFNQKEMPRIRREMAEATAKYLAQPRPEVEVEWTRTLMVCRCGKGIPHPVHRNELAQFQRDCKKEMR